MKTAWTLLFLFVLLGVVNGIGLFSVRKGVNGGIACAGCTFTVGLVEQLAEVHNKSISQTLDDVCKLLPSGGYQKACVDIITRYGPAVIKLLYNKASPDVVCRSIKFCYTDPGQPMCHLFKRPKNDHEDSWGNRISWSEQMAQKFLSKDPYFNKENLDFCDVPGIKFICDLYFRVVDKHIPLVDVDKDGFSTVETFRGTSWRGKDCYFADSSMYPGSKPQNSDTEIDSNCNGIYGVNLDGVPYEDLFCNNTGSMGVGLLGDSAGAHFHIPPEWLTAYQLKKDLLIHLPYVVENEFDWPQMSAYTGYKNITWPIIHGPVQSMYTLMKARNRCIHRDYQNLGVNGARSSSILQGEAIRLSRNQTTDHPMLLFYALVGNDVCNGHPDTVAYMTTPAEMRKNVLKTFHYLDTKLPAGSHLMVLGLADGRVLYDNMHDRYHPFGEVNKDVKFSQFYDFLQCLQISPCNGWMTTNATLRGLTWKRAQQLNVVLRSIVKEYKDKFQNFDMAYLDCPLMPVLSAWMKKHGPKTGWQLIEKVDGFHPNQHALELSALYTYDYIRMNIPHFLGDINPHNDDIDNIFGDQGGY